MHTIQIYRDAATKQWHHRFVHQNGRQLTRQSEGVNKRATAMKSAQTAYGLGELVQNTDTEWIATARNDVHVLVVPTSSRPTPAEQAQETEGAQA